MLQKAVDSPAVATLVTRIRAVPSSSALILARQALARAMEAAEQAEASVSIKRTELGLQTPDAEGLRLEDGLTLARDRVRQARTTLAAVESSAALEVLRHLQSNADDARQLLRSLIGDIEVVAEALAEAAQVAAGHGCAAEMVPVPFRGASALKAFARHARSHM